jgi:hypothetical protein
MGIVVDLNRSGIKFDDKSMTILDRRGLASFTDMTYEFFPFEVTFGISFDPDPKNGIGAAPKEPELWRIGIVQNELWSRSVEEYYGGDKYVIEFHDSAPDCTPETKPFYAEPQVGSGKQPGFMEMRPYSDIWYTAQGYGELLSPIDPIGVNTNNKPDSLNIKDRPSGVAFSRSRKTNTWLKRIEQKSIFQSWLVAKTENNPDGIVLAHVPPFAFCFWLETNLKNYHPTYSYEYPPFDYGVYAESGFSPAAVNRKISLIGATPDLKVALGDGGRKPSMKGITANERIQGAARKIGTHP